MSSQTQRNQMRKIKAEQEGEDLFALEMEPEIPVGQTDYERLVSLRKSPLHLLLLLHLPSIGLESNQALFVNTGDPDRTEKLFALEDGTIKSPHGIFKSLSAAAKAHKEDTWKKGTPDGWETLKIADVASPGKFRSLNTLFVQSFKWMNVPIDVLENEELLYNHLVSMNLGKYANLYYSQKSSAEAKSEKKAKVVTPKARPNKT